LNGRTFLIDRLSRFLLKLDFKEKRSWAQEETQKPFCIWWSRACCGGHHVPAGPGLLLCQPPLMKCLVHPGVSA
jgi:hypothetical protein